MATHPSHLGAGFLLSIWPYVRLMTIWDIKSVDNKGEKQHENHKNQQKA
jgi:hypothetical protein